ncbi:MAG TPA: L-threonylcarbamoyladenylate synthase [bacterium]|nr:L-threonylcarbamoyladenylate synthase [bacterium]HPN31010.1 L-threonylcarbamoyladenylate synthase [bacterium]
MITISKLCPEYIDILNETILSGGIILWPSGGVYGLACSALDKKAVEKLYQLKNRDYGKPLSLIVSPKTAETFAYIPRKAKKILYNLWPDFIGIIAPKKNCVKDFITSGKKTVGLVCSSAVNVFLAENIIVPLASTSANLSGEPEIHDYETACKKFQNTINIIIKHTENINKLNTMVEFDETDGYKILREGKYNQSEISNILD